MESGFLRKLSLSILPAPSPLTSEISGSFVVTKVWNGRERERMSEVRIFSKDFRVMLAAHFKEL